MYIIFASNKY